MHLIYTRFWNKVMRDLGLVKFNEPIKRLLTQGMVTNLVEGTNEWKAMSKSLGNGVDPDEMIEAFGADATRLFVLFAAPVENELRWSETGIEGAVRFLRRVWTMVYRWRARLMKRPAGSLHSEEFSDAARALRRVPGKRRQAGENALQPDAVHARRREPRQVAVGIRVEVRL